VADVVNPPPVTPTLPYPAAATIVLTAIVTGVLLILAGKFDPTKGPLTISLMIVLGMLGTTAYCLVFTIPPDDITPSVVGALSAGFGAVVVYWLGKT
jgi:NADPH-dependent curcumin reductase CurA